MQGFYFIKSTEIATKNFIGIIIKTYNPFTQKVITIKKLIH